MEQPPLPDMKYSRAVIYKIDQNKMTVQQIWEYGKERGFEWYSPITSLVEYQTDKIQHQGPEPGHQRIQVGSQGTLR